ncbi:hypothetical protein OWV82_006720 [Melia azedarach]|uniref:Uncharacterized protein n=1 Tax=Melia azedarach TaxID=155640 RepID=A0ACC1YHS8_MELAZ|nr:hypothetical protein OWV82_006720 [Melia azedarach]
MKFKGKPSAQEELENIRKPGSSRSSDKTSIVAEQQQQQQNLQLEGNHNNVYKHKRLYYHAEADFSDFSAVENHQQQQQQQTLQLDNNIVNETYSNVAENIQMEAMEVEQQQYPEASYDPYYCCYYFDDHNHQLGQAVADLSEEIIPSLWSWQN